MEPRAHEEAAPGLTAGIAAFAKNLSALLLGRVELAALELGELRDNLRRLLLVGVLGVVALLFALGCWTALLVVLSWDALGWKILLLVALLYTVLAVAMLHSARALLASDKLSLPATMAELRNDRDALL
jgi:uncharacterized membrane protein YqjE